MNWSVLSWFAAVVVAPLAQPKVCLSIGPRSQHTMSQARRVNFAPGTIQYRCSKILGGIFAVLQLRATSSRYNP